MKKNHKHQHQQQEQDDIEILKAVAQAWHGHSSSSKAAVETTSEFDAHRQYFKGKPTRFKIEAMSMAARKDQCGSTSWDFRQSLWDSYEIVSVSKKLETGLVMEEDEYGGFSSRRRKESANSLRNLFNRVSSRRFTEEDLPSDGD